jgi:acyl carrier protein
MEETIANIVREMCSGVQMTSADYGRSLKDLGVDSLDVASIFLTIQERLGVRVPDPEIDRLATVRAIAEYVSRAGG